jgi:structural maintenance of chromosome 2
LAEEINPKLAKLRKEKESYLAYTKAVSEAERLGRVMSAFQYTDFTDRIKHRERDIDGMNERIAQLGQQRKERIKEKKKAEAAEGEVTKKRDAEMQKDGKLKGLEEEMGRCEKEAAKVQAQVEIVEGVIKENRTKAEEVQQTLDKVRSECIAFMCC